MMVIKLLFLIESIIDAFVTMLTMMVLKLCLANALIRRTFVIMLTMMVLKPHNMFTLKLLFFTRCFKIKHCYMSKE